MLVGESVVGEVSTCGVTGVKHVSEFEGRREGSGAEDGTSGKVHHRIKGV